MEEHHVEPIEKKSESRKTQHDSHDFYPKFLDFAVQNGLSQTEQNSPNAVEDLKTEISDMFKFFLGFDLVGDAGSNYQTMNTAYQKSIDDFLVFCTKKMKTDTFNTIEGYDESYDKQNKKQYCKKNARGSSIVKHIRGGHLPDHIRQIQKYTWEGGQIEKEKIEQWIWNQRLEMTKMGLSVVSEVSEKKRIYGIQNFKWVMQEKDFEKGDGSNRTVSAVSATRDTPHAKIVKLLSDFLVEEKKKETETKSL